MTDTKCIEIITEFLESLGFTAVYTGSSSIDLCGKYESDTGKEYFIEGSIEAFSEDNGDVRIPYSISFSDDIDPFIGTINLAEPTIHSVKSAIFDLVEPDFITI